MPPAEAVFILSRENTSQNVGEAQIGWFLIGFFRKMGILAEKSLDAFSRLIVEKRTPIFRSAPIDFLDPLVILGR